MTPQARPSSQARELIFTANELSRCIDNISSYPSSDHIRRQLTSMWLALVERVKLVAPEVELDAYLHRPRVATPPDTHQPLTTDTSA